MSNKLQSLWRKKQPLQIIDLENDYFSIRFQDDNEYLSALSGELWTIFGHYLTVRPWTPRFSIDQTHTSNLLVWIRLPWITGRYVQHELTESHWRGD